jgi:hypothetical protein
MIVRCPICKSELPVKSGSAEDLYRQLNQIVKACTADGNDPKVYPLLNWLADRLELMRDGRIAVDENDVVITMLRHKGNLVQSALK